MSLGGAGSRVIVLAVLAPEGAFAGTRVGVARCGRRAFFGKEDTAAPVQKDEALRDREGRPSARWADPLIVFDAGVVDLVTEPERALDLDQILDVHARRERMAAAAAVRRLLRAPAILVEGDPELRRPLEDVEELAERQPEEGADHRHRVEDGDERVAVPSHPRVAR